VSQRICQSWWTERTTPCALAAPAKPAKQASVIAMAAAVFIAQAPGLLRKSWQKVAIIYPSPGILPAESPDYGRLLQLWSRGPMTAFS
jgi:hypothetical protein